jgi:hypothetical protein
MKGLEPLDPHSEDPLPSKLPSPEEIVIKKQLFQKLSREAKEVIGIILEAPDEIVDLIKTREQKRITKRRIKDHLIKTFGGKFTAEMIIKEIQDWVKNL